MDFKVLNSKDYGLPQPRERLYIVLTSKNIVKKPFEWPKGRTPDVKPSLLKICSRNVRGKLVKGDPEKDTPKTGTGLKQYNLAMDAIKEAGLNPDKTNFIIDTGSGRDNVNMRVDEVPTITSTRASSQAYYSTLLKRHLTMHELIRAQGSEPLRFKSLYCISTAQLGRIVGNAMSIPVLEDVLHNAMISVGLLDGAMR